MSTVYTTISDVFRIGVGPSSSHTIGPMRASRNFARLLFEDGLLEQTTSIVCELKGSLAATGVGHHTPNAVVAGLQGYKPNSYIKSQTELVWEDICSAKQSVKLNVFGEKYIEFCEKDILFNAKKIHPKHTNSMTIFAYENETLLRETTYLSVGGGEVWIENGDEYCVLGVIPDKIDIAPPTNLGADDISDYKNATELVKVALKYNTTIAEIARRQEQIHYGDAFADDLVCKRLDLVWETMNNCIERGLNLNKSGNTSPLISPKTLGYYARAPKMYQKVLELQKLGRTYRSEMLSCFALAVNEQNVLGEQIVTAPTAGSAGVIPSVLKFWIENDKQQGWVRSKRQVSLIHEFLLTAGVIGSIIKANGSISGAEAGCQAEVGSACAMAAAGYTAISGGTVEQIENAAEIALEYHLGLTCDPVKGLVFIPCIERNAMAANTAVVAAELALSSNGKHIVSLDTAIETMKQTGIDMNTKYKETSKAGLATFVAC
ncbi:L-serine dehydratase [Actinomycetota bacterium]|nr:L-serine dehydratase [Actinomycetota bacterium]